MVRFGGGGGIATYEAYDSGRSMCIQDSICIMVINRLLAGELSIRIGELSAAKKWKSRFTSLHWKGVF